MWLARFAHRRRPVSVPAAPSEARTTRSAIGGQHDHPSQRQKMDAELVLCVLIDMHAHPQHADGRPKPDRHAQVFRLMLALDRGSFQVLMRRLHTAYHRALMPILLDCYPLY